MQAIWLAMSKGDKGEDPAWGQVHVMSSEVHGRPVVPLTSPHLAYFHPSAQTCGHTRFLKH